MLSFTYFFIRHAFQRICLKIKGSQLCRPKFELKGQMGGMNSVKVCSILSPKFQIERKGVVERGGWYKVIASDTSRPKFIISPFLIVKQSLQDIIIFF